MKVRLPWTMSVPVIIFGAFLIIAGLNLLIQKYTFVVNLQNEAADLVVVLLFISAGTVMIQFGIRSMSRIPHDPTRHTFSDWTIYPVGILWVVLGLLVTVEGSFYGLFPLGIGALILYYVFKRPKIRKPSPFFRLEMPITNPNAWTRLVIGKNAHFFVFGGYFVAWIFPWGLLSTMAWHQDLVHYLMPYISGLDALYNQAANPEFSVGLMSTVILLSPITLLVSATQAQTADRVVTGDYEVRYAWKALLFCLVLLAAILTTYVDIPHGNSALQDLAKQSTLALALQQVSFLWGANAVVLIILSLSKGIIGYYREGA